MATKVLSTDFETEDLVKILSLTKKLKLSPFKTDYSDLSVNKTIQNPIFTSSVKEKFKNIFPSVTNETAENHISLSKGSFEETVEKYRKYFQQSKLKTVSHNRLIQRKRNFKESTSTKSHVELIAERMINFEKKKELRDYLYLLLMGMKEKLLQKKKYNEFVSIAKGLNEKISSYNKTLGVVTKCLEEEKGKNEKLKEEIRQKEKEKEGLIASIEAEMRVEEKYKSIIEQIEE